MPVIEVTSPSTRTVDLTEKLPDYARAGTPEHWVVDAERSEVRVHQLRRREYASRVVTGGRLGGGELQVSG
ncbi:MAG: Uma2 family endonuclease [Armatimonadota bacterium]|nr:Uma2 family endonuclease [Armatimonadota bacterium]MDR7409756.1 Uma2 family endonuclease [Armatimonadota bacterium]MDR7425486.1 Uma2 family endonuclease [Armatimonadota bacterium]